MASELHFKGRQHFTAGFTYSPSISWVPAVCHKLSLALRMQQWTGQGPSPEKLTILVGEHC